MKKKNVMELILGTIFWALLTIASQILIALKMTQTSSPEVVNDITEKKLSKNRYLKHSFHR